MCIITRPVGASDRTGFISVQGGFPPQRAQGYNLSNMNAANSPEQAAGGTLALLGGEGLRADPGTLWRALAALRPGGVKRLVVIPAALSAHRTGAPERRAALAAEVLDGLGFRVEAAPVHSRADAEDPAATRAIAGADACLLTDGRPDALAETLRGTGLWHALLDAWRGGCLLAAAGGAATGLAEVSFRPTEPPPEALDELAYQPTGGLGVLRGMVVLPFAGWLQRELVARIETILPPDTALVEIDEAAALVFDGVSWQVLGAGSVAVTPPGRPVRHVPAGQPLPDGFLPPPER